MASFTQTDALYSDIYQSLYILKNTLQEKKQNQSIDSNQSIEAIFELALNNLNAFKEFDR